MAYTAWSVVYGEQPTAAKWNQLGQNDAGFKDGTNIDDDAILNRHLSAAIVGVAELATDTFVWEKLADVTLGSTATSISSGTIAARSFLKIMLIGIFFRFPYVFDYSIISFKSYNTTWFIVTQFWRQCVSAIAAFIS